MITSHPKHSRIILVARLQLVDQGLTLYENTNLGFPTFLQSHASAAVICTTPGQPRGRWSILLYLTVSMNRHPRQMEHRGCDYDTAVVTLSATLLMHVDGSDRRLTSEGNDLHTYRYSGKKTRDVDHLTVVVLILLLMNASMFDHLIRIIRFNLSSSLL